MKRRSHLKSIRVRINVAAETPAKLLALLAEIRREIAEDLALPRLETYASTYFYDYDVKLPKEKPGS